MKYRPISMRHAFDFAWPAFKKRFGLFTGVLLTILGAWVVLEIVVIAGQRFGLLLWAVMHLSFLIFVAGVEVGLLQICRALRDGKVPAFADTFAYLPLGPKFLAAQILYLLMVVIGLLLLVFPGLYLGARYALFGFCFADGETNPLRCFQQSSILSEGATIGVLRIVATLLVLNVLGASLLALGLFITVPLSALIMTDVYRQLTTPPPADSIPAPHWPSRVPHPFGFWRMAPTPSVGEVLGAPYAGFACGSLNFQPGAASLWFLAGGPNSVRR